MRERLLVMQVKGRVVTGLTEDGQFVNRRWSGPVPVVGQLVDRPARVPLVSLAPRWRLVAVAMSLLLIMALQLPGLTPLARAGTVVAIDLVPSVEVTLTPDGDVASARAVNPEGEALLQSVGKLPPSLGDAVELLIDATAQSGKLATDRDNIVMITAIPGWRGLPAKLDLNGLEARVVAKLEKLGVPALTLVGTASRLEAVQAKQSGTSVNRYVITQTLRDDGKDVKPEEARGKSVQQLVDEHCEDPEKEIGGKRSGPKNKGGNGKGPGGATNESGDGSTTVTGVNQGTTQTGNGRPSGRQPDTGRGR